MNRTWKDSLVAGRNMPTRTRHRRGLSLTGMSKETDENLDLFSRNRRSLSVASSDETDVSMKLGRLSVGSAKLACSGMDDLLSSADGGKHDYDWLLTPPGTPVFPSSDGSESPSAAPRSRSLVRSVSTNKTSRLSVSQSRSIRSSSVTRPSVSTSQYSSTYSTSILNTSSGSVSSYIRPSSPATRSSISSSIARPSTPSSRSSVSSSATTPPTPSARPGTFRSLTCSKARPPPTTSSIDRTRPYINSRPSTPNSRPSTPNSRSSIPANLNSPATRSSSRPSTPARRNSAPSLSPSTAPLSSETGLSTSVGQVPSKGRNAVTLSRPSSPSPRVLPPPQPLILPPPQPLILPAFSLETPPNLRTTLPDRPLSASRSRPGAAVAVKENVETPTPTNVLRRPSPLVSRGRLTEPPVRGRVHTISQAFDTMESRKVSLVPELSTRRPIKSSTTSTESSGFGRNISKKSLDMAIRHMDIRNGTSGIRLLSGATRFPQSIRSSSNTKNQTGRASSAPPYANGFISQNGNYRSPENGMNKEHCQLSAKLSEVDMYESCRYDTILFKEDMKNTNWLHSCDDQGPHIFDYGFEPLPEPFDPL